MTLHVAGLWRYPVKSLAGEPLNTAVIGPDGIPGDRIVRVRGPEGVRTSRRQYRLLGLRAVLDPSGLPRIEGRAWNSPKALALVKAAAGNDAWLEAWEGLDRFDILPLLVATDGAVAAFGRDVRRLRPNILIAGAQGLDERSWPGAELHIGDVVLRLDSLRGRCHMTTVDPDTLQVDPGVLRDIVRRFDSRLARSTPTSSARARSKWAILCGSCGTSSAALTTQTAANARHNPSAYATFAAHIFERADRPPNLRYGLSQGGRPF